ncbi:MAG: hypothetical protein K0R15_337 [Clostridiales bacterium]|nr:hypothetical protein [Clostridiales bacterium]
MTWLSLCSMDQLQHTIKRYYGNDFDACRYLCSSKSNSSWSTGDKYPVIYSAPNLLAVLIKHFYLLIYFLIIMIGIHILGIVLKRVKMWYGQYLLKSGINNVRVKKKLPANIDVVDFLL